MNGVLIGRSLRDSWLMLVGCAALVAAFVTLRVWIASMIKFDAFIQLFSEGLKFVQGLFPVPLEDLASPLGRVAFSFEEFPTIVIMGLWGIARGSECIVGRVGAGTMEMLLAQPIRRLSVVTSHAVVTLAGVAVLAAAAWCGVGFGLMIAEFDAPPAWSKYGPATLNYMGLGVFIACAATLVSALARTRAQAVGLVVGFYVVELTLMIMSRLSDRFEWLQWFTILTAYEPTLLTIGIEREPGAAWPQFWQYNAVLFGLGGLLLAAATAIFCRRDVPAPL